MRDVASRAVVALGDNWGVLGWLTFIAWFVLSFWSPEPWPVLTALSLWLLWWVTDLVDQRAPLWKVVLGIGMLAIGFLPRGGLLALAAWVLYWTKVRE